MRTIQIFALAGAVALLPAAANATLIGSLGGGGGNFLSLTAAGLNGGTVAALSGGTIYTSDQPFADIPKGGVFGGTFLAAGPRAGEPATLTFTTPTNYLSFLWGSPDQYNVLTLTTNLAQYTFTAMNLGFAVTNGDQSFSQYAQFIGSAGESIRSVSFNNVPAQDAFETANFSVTPVPEAATWAMFIGGFGMLGAAMRRRKTAVSFA